MHKLFVLTLILLSHPASYGQAKPVLVYDLEQGTLDSILPVTGDSTVLRDHTPFHTGTYNNTFLSLDSLPPNDGIFPGSRFSKKKRAASEYDLTGFPIRTTVKIVQYRAGEEEALCSGSMVSGRHVLSAAHCVAESMQNTLRDFDSLAIYPVYDNGVPNPDFPRVRVNKVYFFRDWSMAGEDQALLELEGEPGKRTGWIGIGFEENDTLLLEGIFYKFSYPATTILSLDSNEYDGDSLYYNFGEADLANPYYVGIYNTNGIPGESGSSLIKVQNGQTYTSYGVLTFSHNLTHSRINRWRFYTLKSILEDDLTLDAPSSPETVIPVVYPNPADKQLFVTGLTEDKTREILLLDALGKTCLRQTGQKDRFELDVSMLPAGIYYLILQGEHTRYTERVILQ